MRFLRWTFVNVLFLSFSYLPFMGSSEGFVVVQRGLFPTVADPAKKICRSRSRRCSGIRFGSRLDSVFVVKAQLWSEEQQNQEREGVLAPTPYWEPALHLKSELLGLGGFCLLVFKLINHASSTTTRHLRFDAVYAYFSAQDPRVPFQGQRVHASCLELYLHVRAFVHACVNE